MTMRNMGPNSYRIVPNTSGKLNALLTYPRDDILATAA